MPEDIIEYLKCLDLERYRGLIIHTTPEKSAALTEFCQKVCRGTGGKYLDLLDFFIQSKNLAENIDRFGPEKLRELLVEQSQNHSLLVVDRCDFLLDTWRKTEKQDLYQLLDNQWDGFKDGMKAKLLVCLQTSGELELLDMKDSRGQSRVRPLVDFNDIV